MILVGYWKERGKDNYIDPNLLVNLNWQKADRENIVSYLKGGKFMNGYFGWSTCRICGCKNGATELTDGLFCWPEGLAHYVEKHNVMLPDEFVEHMRAADFNPAAKMNNFQNLNQDFWNRWCQKKKQQLSGFRLGL